MIKNLTQTLFTALFFALLIACGTKKETTATETATDSTSADADEWKAMDDFHMIMAESFHPFKDSANLAPAKAKAAELAASAEQWLATPLPEKVNNENVKAKLETLKKKNNGLCGDLKINRR